MMIRRIDPVRSSTPPQRAALGLREVLHVLFRHKRKMMVCFSTVSALVILAVVFYPRTYTSDARLFVRLGKESVALDPTATLGATVNVEESRESQINSELEILRSRGLREDVVERLGADEVLGKRDDSKGKEGLLQTALAQVLAVKTWLLGDVDPKERALVMLEKSLSATAARRSNVIILASRASDPTQAQRILQAYLESYLVHHTKANLTSGSYAFFVDQSKYAREQLEQATTQLRQAKNESGLLSVAGHQSNLQAQATSIEVAMHDNQRALAASEAKIAALRRAMADLPEKLAAEETSGLANVAGDSMRHELYKVEILEKELSSRFTAEHPSVIAARRQLTEARKIFAEQDERRTTTTHRPNLLHQGVHGDLLAAQALAAAQRAMGEAIEGQYASIQSKIRALNDNEYRIMELTRQVELLDVSYRKYASNREQARIDQALEGGKISNVNVVQPASYVATASSPKAALMLLLGFLGAALGSVLVALAAEYFDRSLQSPEQIENELGIPVLLSVPRGSRYELLPN